MWPRFVSSSPDFDALEADRARQRASARRLRLPPRRRRDRRHRPKAHRPRRPAADSAAAPPARRSARPIWPDFRGRGARRPIGGGDSHRLAGRGARAAVEAADRSWLRVVRRRRRPRFHDRAAAAAGDRRRLRRRIRPRALDQRVGRRVRRGDGRRWPARDADLPRWPRLRARRPRRAALPRRRDGHGRVAPQYSRGQRRQQSRLGDVGRAAHRRRQGGGAARRQRRPLGRRLQQDVRRSDLARARRSPGVRVADARDAGRRPTDSDRQRDACRRARSRAGHAPVGLSVADGHGHQRRPAGSARRRSRVPVGELRSGRRRVRSDARGRSVRRRGRSGRTPG